MLRRLARRVLDKLRPPSNSSPTSSPPVSAAPPPEEEDNAAHLAHIECGAQEVKERIDAGEPVVLLDVRESFQTAGGIIPGALVIPLGQLQRRWEELKDANEVVCYCAAGVRSFQAAAFLREKGLINATSMEGGISQWMQIGGKVQMPDGRLA